VGYQYCTGLFPIDLKNKGAKLGRAMGLVGGSVDADHGGYVN